MRQTIVINDVLYKELEVYIEKTYGKDRRVLSVVIEKAIKEFLEQMGCIDKLYRGKGDGGGEK